MAFVMRRALRILLVAGVLGCGTIVAAADKKAQKWTDLELRDLSGAALAKDTAWVVFVFLSPECPVANAAIPVLNALAAEFARSTRIVGVYADPSLEISTLREHASDYRLTFVCVDDRAQKIVRFTGASYTPEVFVYSRDGALQYRGRIDDRVKSFGAAKPSATQADLRDVIVALDAGKPPPFATRPGFGCSIPALEK
ncbi:redoxin domain-containing protein [Oleiharenicola lentus]|uniref:redoxin domain-containing protein n=1 Tax=Oleiharenicola lentus TaxID=2508720 RepID=UPI003F67C8EB